MADFDSTGAVVSDDEGKETTVMNGSSKEETDMSNNSSSQKKGTNSASRSVRSRPRKKNSNQELFQNQIARRQDILEEIQRGYTYDDHTQAFLNFLGRPNVEARDVKSKVFKNQLMLSETMDELPAGFAKNWSMVVCPVGSRCLVVASMGHTGAYTKTGYHIISHPSNLPMGNKTMQGFGSCVLDCIYCNESETYFVLDLMCWDGQPFYDCDSQTRFRILQENIREYDLGRPSHQNPYAFVPLKTFTPTKSNICAAVRMAPYLIDGLLFYHKQATYSPGVTPLVLWLTLDRLPIKMKIEIPEMGIVTAVNYKDPVALALAHGVSPAIISQVYPSNRNDRGQQRNHWNQGRDAYGPDMHYQELHVAPHSHGLDQGPQRYRERRQMRRGPGPMGPHDDFAYLSDMMMNLNLMPGERKHYRQYDHGMMANGNPYYENFNCNNNSNGCYFRNHNARGRTPYQPQYLKSKQKRKKPQSKQASQNDQRIPNWEEPHGVMKSQWMEKKPENFENDYITCICPLAKRRIIVAANGKTCSYNKYGKLVETFTSSLPNGGPAALTNGEKEEDLTILDCLWCGSYQKFYVLDVMHWRQQPFYDAEADFRFFWLADKLNDVILKSGKKEYAVEMLPKYANDRETLCAALSAVEYKVDGLLCYHRNGKYSVTSSSNALWFKLDMMEELLGYPPPSDVSYKPSTEKERKQRAHFISLSNGKDCQTPAEESNSEEEEKEAPKAKE